MDAVVPVPLLPVVGKRWIGVTAQLTVDPAGTFPKVKLVADVQMRFGPEMGPAEQEHKQLPLATLFRITFPGWIPKPLLKLIPTLCVWQ